jgi:hypothetical protein
MNRLPHPGCKCRICEKRRAAIDEENPITCAENDPGSCCYDPTWPKGQAGLRKLDWMTREAPDRLWRKYINEKPAPSIDTRYELLEMRVALLEHEARERIQATLDFRRRHVNPNLKRT